MSEHCKETCPEHGTECSISRSLAQMKDGSNFDQHPHLCVRVVRGENKIHTWG